MPLSKKAIQKKAAKIRFLAMDVDGVLTNGDIVLLESGEEIKVFNSKDRLILAYISRRKVPLGLGWITGRSSRAVKAAAKGLGVPYLAQGSHKKLGPFKEFLEAEGVPLSEAAFIGDDLIDLPAMKAAGLSICPADATTDALAIADYVSPIKGGRGVVRDAVELILKARKEWDPLVQSFYS